MAPESPVAARIRAALAEHLKRDVSKVQLQDELKKDLGLDSLAMIELLFKIEEAFDLEIPNDDLSQITTVGDVIAYVEHRLGGGAPAPRPVAAATAAVPHPDVLVQATAKPAAPKKKGSPRA
jgi:acyl carrier protein